MAKKPVRLIIIDYFIQQIHIVTNLLIKGLPDTFNDKRAKTPPEN